MLYSLTGAGAVPDDGGAFPQVSSAGSVNRASGAMSRAFVSWAGPVALGTGRFRYGSFKGCGGSGNGVSLEEPPQAESPIATAKRPASQARCQSAREHPGIRIEAGFIVQEPNSTLRRNRRRVLSPASPGKAAVDRYPRPGYVPGSAPARKRMIGKLKGTIIADEPPMLTVEVSGVGYEVATPIGTGARARTSEGLIALWVHTVLRSDALELFGFATELERRVFRQLIAVPNVGPRTALGVLSALPVRELVEAIEGSDVVRLTRVPGIGKRTAERLVLELRGKLPTDPVSGTPHVSRQAPAGGDAKSRVLSALVNMGYRPVEAERAVSALGPRVGEAPLAELLREALAQLSPSG